jgi:prevent-host-death family protein
MKAVGIRALKQNASAVVADAAAGEVVVITDRGRPVAQLGPVAVDRLAALTASGSVRPARRSLADLVPPEPGVPLSKIVEELRRDERY